MVQFKISRDADLGLHLNVADVLEDTLVAKLCLGDSPGILSFHSTQRPDVSATRFTVSFDKCGCHRALMSLIVASHNTHEKINN